MSRIVPAVLLLLILPVLLVQALEPEPAAPARLTVTRTDGHALIRAMLTQNVGALQESPLIAAGKRIIVQTLEPALPAQTLENWLGGLPGLSGIVIWEVTDCGEGTGDPARDRNAELPACVDASSRLVDGRVVTISLLSGRWVNGTPVASGPAALWQVAIHATEAQPVFLKRLQDLEGALPAIGACVPSFDPIDSVRGLPHTYVDQALASLPRLYPQYELLAQRRNAHVGGVEFALVVYRKDAAGAVAIDGAAVSDSRAWRFGATCEGPAAWNALVTTLEALSALPREK